MYSKPTLVRFGTFRQVTQFGSNMRQADLLTMGGTTQDDSCNPNDPDVAGGFGCPGGSR